MAGAGQQHEDREIACPWLETVERIGDRIGPVGEPCRAAARRPDCTGNTVADTARLRISALRQPRHFRLEAPVAHLFRQRRHVIAQVDGDQIGDGHNRFRCYCIPELRRR